MTRCNRRQGGFTLLEMLAAIVLLALGLTVLMSALRDAARDQLVGETKVGMAQVARSLMAEHSLQILQPGFEAGERDGIHWRFECTLRDSLPGIGLYHLALTLRQGQREERFTTLRLQRAQVIAQ
ncbi:type II secretion system protein [Pseudomonas qingdaonensis]|uniref:Type II secretion system protein n=1 Tax=Pseudomonas qingdaonensis TaxID=2056231 RepID=A0ABX8DS51_9PSED|nr:type II secretion system protein [Pseudomonas qingdaonensis]QVL18972.1 type II secretion system protein [Pseudomonas qingdaonensis]